MSDITLATPRAVGGAALEGPRARDYAALMKPRVMSLVVFTGLVGLVLAPGETHPVLAAAALLSIAVGAGASGAINMWYDADIDARMARTAGRPVPAGRIAPGEALGFGSALAVGAVLMMGLVGNWTAAALLAFTIGFYVFVYTMWLKRRTPYNIVVGGAAGALPPVIGWAAASGEVGLGAVLLFAVIFVWTPPHFWALAIVRRGEYARAGVPMLPVVAGERETRRQILAYSLILLPVSLLPWWYGVAGAGYGITAAALGFLFLVAAIQLWVRSDAGSDPRAARRLFVFSILYLFLLFAALLAEGAAGAA